MFVCRRGNSPTGQVKRGQSTVVVIHLGIRKDEGQSYDDDAVAVDGKQDHFRVLRRAQGSGEELTTQAQAEGTFEVQV